MPDWVWAQAGDTQTRTGTHTVVCPLQAAVAFARPNAVAAQVRFAHAQPGQASAASKGMVARHWHEGTRTPALFDGTPKRTRIPLPPQHTAGPARVLLNN